MGRCGGHDEAQDGPIALHNGSCVLAIHIHCRFGICGKQAAMSKQERFRGGGGREEAAGPKFPPPSSGSFRLVEFSTVSCSTVSCSTVKIKFSSF